MTPGPFSVPRPTPATRHRVTNSSTDYFADVKVTRTRRGFLKAPAAAIASGEFGCRAAEAGLPTRQLHSSICETSTRVFSSLALALSGAISNAWRNVSSPLRFVVREFIFGDRDQPLGIVVVLIQHLPDNCLGQALISRGVGNV